MAQSVNIHFYGGTGSVTGSNFMLEVPAASEPTRCLIDCGLFQGARTCELENWNPLPYDPHSVTALFVTHAHLDHVGRIPVLFREGFTGPIYSTPPTRDIARLILEDGLRVLEHERESCGKPPLYTTADIETALAHWQVVPYHEPITIGPLTAVLRDAGHILGSAMVEFSYAGKKIVFTGDLGNSPTPLLPDTEALSDTNYLVMESVYGDRNHEGRETRRAMLEDIIEDTMRKNGTLMIPAFSLERTQELLFEIENMMESSRIPLVPVYVDSPLAIKISEVYKRYPEYCNANVREIIRRGDGILQFPQLHLTLSTEASRAIEATPGRKIIIAGSGMSTGGRIIHHEHDRLSDPKSTLLLVGYQPVGSLGRVLADGEKHVTILGEPVQVNARVASIAGYSAHKDSAHLLEFVRGTADTLERVFLAMGEPKASLFLAQRIRDYLGVDAVVPKAGNVITIELA